VAVFLLPSDEFRRRRSWGRRGSPNRDCARTNIADLGLNSAAVGYAANIAVFSLGDIEDDHMGVKLRRGISIHGTATVMLKLRGDPSASCFWRMVSANARLDVSFQLVKRHVNRFSVCHADALVSAH
jgi:hypothetical protein